MIYKSNALSFIHLATLFEKLQKHEVELKRLDENEEGDKKKKSIALKVTKAKDIKSEDGDYQNESYVDVDFMFRKFEEFLRHEKKTPKFQKQSKEISTFIYT